jgi:hypothetical protein
MFMICSRSAFIFIIIIISSSIIIRPTALCGTWHSTSFGLRDKSLFWVGLSLYANLLAIMEGRRFYVRVFFPSRQSQSQSQSRITTDDQSVSMSWCQAQSGTFDQRFFSSNVTVLSLWGALSDERSGQSFVILCQYSLK